MKDTIKYQAKVWGDTACVMGHPMFSVHHLVVRPGTFCSVHRHRHRVNLFYVLSGSLVVRRWDTAERTTDVKIERGERFWVPPGTYHQFLSRQGAEVLEIYFPVLPEDEDIERLTEGGVML